MRTKFAVLLGAVLVAAGVYIWLAGNSVSPIKPAQTPAQQSNPKQEDVAHKGDGSGGNREDKGKQQADCSDSLSLYAGQQLLWQKQSQAFEDMPEVQPLNAGHRASTQGVNVLVLAGMAPDITVVEVVTCEGDVARFPVDKVQQDTRQFFIGANRRGAFKLIELSDGMEHTLMRNVSQVALKQGGQRRSED
ncbi:hypothetical protein [Alcanivorax sp. 1008]|uniref:hypothetical protein n=1 Tax=Alcanivorax sp. 1008 TaxID=2816853 RepID=UPI001DA67ADF|nr:hypothetical protein [Alcanivorax sp. 1008]MCC1495346.1 hypothetical protein [Alcanivorax sp. 1008]